MLAEYEVPYSHLEIGATLGEGAFGKVVKVRYAGSDFAAKMLKVHPDDLDDQVRNFRREVSTKTLMHHTGEGTI